MQRRARYCRGTDHFADGFNARTRFDSTHNAPYVREYRQMFFGGQAEHLNDFADASRPACYWIPMPMPIPPRASSCLGVL